MTRRIAETLKMGLSAECKDWGIAISRLDIQEIVPPQTLVDARNKRNTDRVAFEAESQATLAKLESALRQQKLQHEFDVEQLQHKATLESLQAKAAREVDAIRAESELARLAGLEKVRTGLAAVWVLSEAQTRQWESAGKAHSLTLWAGVRPMSRYGTPVGEV